MTPDRSGVEFAKALFEVAPAYPEAETIHLVMDNLSTHSRKSLTDLCGEEFGGEIWDAFTPHYTPVHGSWLNQAEIEPSLRLGKAREPAPWRTETEPTQRPEPKKPGCWTERGRNRGRNRGAKPGQPQLARGGETGGAKPGRGRNRDSLN